MTKTEYIDILTDIELIRLSIKLEDDCSIIEHLIEELKELEKKL